MSMRDDSLAAHGAEGRNGGDVRLGELQADTPLIPGLAEVCPSPATEQPVASSECPVCGVNTPHTHTRESLARTYREEELRQIFEETLENGLWWNAGLRECPQNYGQRPLLTHKKFHHFPHHKEGTKEGDAYMWWPVQLLWEVFCYMPLWGGQPPLPDTGIPDVNEALEIKKRPFASPVTARGEAVACDHRNTVTFSHQGIDWCGDCGAIRVVGWCDGKWKSHNRPVAAPSGLREACEKLVREWLRQRDVVILASNEEEAVATSATLMTCADELERMLGEQ